MEEEVKANIKDLADNELEKMAASANLDSYDRLLMQKIRDKAVVKFEQDIYSLIYLCFKSENVKKF